MPPNRKLSAYEMELRRKELKELKKKYFIEEKINKSTERKQVESQKVRKLMPVFKEQVKNGDSKTVRKVTNVEKIKTQGKKSCDNPQYEKRRSEASTSRRQDDGASTSRRQDDGVNFDLEFELQNSSLSLDDSMPDPNGSDSVEDGKEMFAWLISPITPADFFHNIWEKVPLHVGRRDYPDYFKDVLSSKKIHNIIRDNYVLFSKNIDITLYRNGRRETYNPTGRAIPSVVWDYYKKGCSVRMLNPQTYSPEMRKLCATLQEFFGCFVGSNSYLTPADSQGFAPHYDDIEAFILQLEGRKHWKVYAPRKPEEVLPRFSSPNFSESDLPSPLLDLVLEPGDFLYIPRGFIHQASTDPHHHSLHVTVSCYQRNTWGDLLEKLVPAALTIAQEEDEEFRKGLPLNYLRNVGVSNCDRFTPDRIKFLEQIKVLFKRLVTHAPIDAAVDQMGKQFMHDALPPSLSAEEESCSVFAENLVKLRSDGSASGRIALKESSLVKLVRSYILRLVKEESENENVRVYHCVDNSLEYHGEDPMMFEISADYALGVERLLLSYPEFMLVSDLPLRSTKDRLDLANMLWKKGVLLTKYPLASTEG